MSAATMTWPAETGTPASSSTPDCGSAVTVIEASASPSWSLNAKSARVNTYAAPAAADTAPSAEVGARFSGATLITTVAVLFLLRRIANADGKHGEGEFFRLVEGACSHGGLAVCQEHGGL